MNNRYAGLVVIVLSLVAGGVFAQSLPGKAGGRGASTEPIKLQVHASEKDAGGVQVSDEPGNDLITVNLNNVPLREVIQMFARVSGANIVTGVDFEDRVSVNLKDVEWEPALRMILGVANKGMLEKSPGMWVVMSEEDLKKEPLTIAPLSLNFVTVPDVLPVIRSLVSTNGTASGFPSANVVVVQDTFPQIELIKDIVAEIDKPMSQVCIEAKFVQLNDSASKNVGLNWSVLDNYTVRAGNMSYEYTKTENDISQNSTVYSDSKLETTAGDYTTEFHESSSSGGNLDGHLGGNNFTDYDAETGSLTIVPESDTKEITSAILSADEFALTLSALENDDGAEVVSNPKIIVGSGRLATIHVGDRTPNIRAYPQGDQGDRYAYALDSKMPFFDIGVKVEVTATVNTETNITVKIVPELSEENGYVPAGATRYPIISSRRIETEFSIANGKTIAIGGLTKGTDKEEVTRIPLLGRIPILGTYLFSHTHTEREQDEVIIFVSVELAYAGGMREDLGIPSKGQLIHKLLAKERLIKEGPPEDEDSEGE